MIIPDPIMQELAKGDFTIIIKHFKLLMAEEDLEDSWRLIKHGINLNFDINSVLKGHVTMKEKSDMVMVDGQWYNLKKYWDELDNREALARAILYKHLNVNEPVAPR